MNFLLVMIGGFIGANLRYLMSLWLSNTDLVFPIATFVTNIIGCFVLGYLTSLVARNFHYSNKIKLLFGTGLIGSFTTFSTFSVETIQLFENNHLILAFVYILGSIFIGLFTAYFGLHLANLQKTWGEAK